MPSMLEQRNGVAIPANAAELHQPHPSHKPIVAPRARYRIGQKVLCVVLLLLAIAVLEQDDDDSTDDTNPLPHAQWAVWAALRAHPPSLRIFRALLEFNLLVWGVVASLVLWYTYIGRTVVAELLLSTTTPTHDDLLYHHLATTAVVGGDNKKTTNHRDDNNHHGTDVSSLCGFNVVYRPHESHSDDGHLNLAFAAGSDDTKTVETNQEALLAKGPDPFPYQYNEDTIDSNAHVDDASKANANNNSQEEDDEFKDVSEISLIVEEDTTPWAPVVDETANAALDMLLPTLLALFFFTYLSVTSPKEEQQVDDMNLPFWSLLHRLAAPVVPLILVVYLTVVQLLRPWSARKQFAWIVALTVGAPLFPVTFRDGFLGDILTSSVRPMQDVMFTVCYTVSGLQGWWSHNDAFHLSAFQQNNPTNDNHHDDDAVASLPTHEDAATTQALLHLQLPPLETSWFLHTILLPMCMVSPLWWRFLQNLRQVYDERRRWPYLGNAFKYLLAAEVAMFGAFDPSKKQTILWIFWFVIATLYQVWWDVFMDWELLVVAKLSPGTNEDAWWKWPTRLRLRSTRLYPSKALYWSVVWINFVLRFCWTLSFLPTRYLNQAGVLSDTFQHSDWSRVLAPAIASAEIIRRTMWGWIRLENEAIKVYHPQQPQQKQQQESQELELGDLKDNNHDKNRGMDPRDMELEPMVVAGGSSLSGERWSGRNHQGLVPMVLKQFKSMQQMSEVQILAELSMWAAVFTILGMVAAYHRMTL